MMNPKKRVTRSTLNFLKDNVLGVTDLTRTNKLSEILNQFAGVESDEVYIIQNHKNKDATGVLIDLEHMDRLLAIEEFYEKIVDDYMYQIALERKDEVADIPLESVIAEENLDADEILNLVDTLELDED
ncbi:hypothetical protein B4099_3711 [Heyndrickxia coagulans]|jgi:hypothetical protein|uniref:Uncharacterized protein n=2 Tax=Bacillaceae TaxID=186817 RepID=A0A150KE78_HEYCO|nr:hypothetical protein B4099_3711 [Heyndrickxia coagulans]